MPQPAAVALDELQRQRMHLSHRHQRAGFRQVILGDPPIRVAGYHHVLVRRRACCPMHGPHATHQGSGRHRRDRDEAHQPAHPPRWSVGAIDSGQRRRLAAMRPHAPELGDSGDGEPRPQQHEDAGAETHHEIGVDAPRRHRDPPLVPRRHRQSDRSRHHHGNADQHSQEAQQGQHSQHGSLGRTHDPSFHFEAPEVIRRTQAAPRRRRAP